MEAVKIGNAELYNGDCLEVMKIIPDGSVDMILCDLPYGTTQCKWDVIIPFDLLWMQYNRVLKKDGACVLFCAQPFTSVLVASNIRDFKYDWCWKKPKGTGHLNAKKQPMRDKEDIVVFYREQCTYNPQMIAGDPYKAKPGKSKTNHDGQDCYGQYKDVREDNEGFRYPKQCLEFGIVERDKLHPTQKPVDILEWMINTYSNTGQTVLDNTMGSGSTGVACARTGRKFIGIEWSPEPPHDRYFNVAIKRLRDESYMLPLGV